MIHIKFRIRVTLRLEFLSCVLSPLGAEYILVTAVILFILNYLNLSVITFQDTL